MNVLQSCPSDTSRFTIVLILTAAIAIQDLLLRHKQKKRVSCHLQTLGIPQHFRLFNSTTSLVASVFPRFLIPSVSVPATRKRLLELHLQFHRFPFSPFITTVLRVLNVRMEAHNKRGDNFKIMKMQMMHKKLSLGFRFRGRRLHLMKSVKYDARLT